MSVDEDAVRALLQAHDPVGSGDEREPPRLAVLDSLLRLSDSPNRSTSVAVQSTAPGRRGWSVPLALAGCLAVGVLVVSVGLTRGSDTAVTVPAAPGAAAEARHAPELGTVTLPPTSRLLGRLGSVPAAAEGSTVIVLAESETAHGRRQVLASMRPDGIACIGSRVGAGDVQPGACLVVGSIGGLGANTSADADDPVSVVQGFAPVGAVRVVVSASSADPVEVRAFRAGASFGDHTYFIADWPHRVTPHLAAYDAAGKTLATSEGPDIGALFPSPT